MVERTEEEVVYQDPIVVILGGKKVNVKPLVARDSRPWRKKVIALISDLPKYTEADTSKPEEFREALQVLMVASPDQVLDLFFEYAKDLDQKEIEAIATEPEINAAFQVVMDYTYRPLQETPPPRKKKSQRQRG